MTGRWLAEWAWHQTSSRAVIHAFNVVLVAFVMFTVWLLVVLVRFRAALTRALSEAGKW